MATVSIKWGSVTHALFGRSRSSWIRFPSVHDGEIFCPSKSVLLLLPSLLGCLDGSDTPIALLWLLQNVWLKKHNGQEPTH